MDQSIRSSCLKLFECLGQNPGSWVLSAERLKTSADILCESAWPEDRSAHDQDAAVTDYTIGPVYMMLMGMAVENVLKAMLVAKDPALVESQKLATEFKTHDLLSLRERLGLRQCGTYDKLLRRLRAFIGAFGRYPVTALKRDIDSMIVCTFHGRTDFTATDRLWRWLLKRLYDVCPETDPEYHRNSANKILESTEANAPDPQN